jgi:hypothetical protein
MWSGGEIKRLLNGKWKAWTIPAIPAISEFGRERGNAKERWEITSSANPLLQGTIGVVGADRDHALIMIPDGVFEFDAATGRASAVLTTGKSGLSRLVAIAPGLDGSAIVAGRGGWGRLWRSSGSLWNWKSLPRPPSKYAEFDFPLETAADGFFLTGVTGSATPAVLRFDGSTWTELYRGESRSVQGWPGENGSVWVADGNQLFEKAGSHRFVSEKAATLSGIVMKVTPEAPGTFWVSTSQGLSRSSPRLWQTPEGSPPVDDVVSSIAEDSRGNVWFLAAHALIRYDNSKWKTWALPRGETAWAIFTQGMQIFRDGRVVIRVTANHLLLFNPETGHFRAITHPKGRVVRMLQQTADGEVLAETSEGRADNGKLSDVSLEKFDGENFTQIAGTEQMGHSKEVRSVAIQPGGDILVGTQYYLGLWHDGRFRKFGAEDGFTDTSAYALYRTPEGRVYAGGRDGLFELDGSKWRLIQRNLDRVRRMVAGRDGTLWVASGSGIHRYRKGIWLSNGEDEGLPSSVAYNVFEDSKGRV